MVKDVLKQIRRARQLVRRATGYMEGEKEKEYGSSWSDFISKHERPPRTLYIVEQGESGLVVTQFTDLQDIKHLRDNIRADFLPDIADELIRTIHPVDKSTVDVYADDHNIPIHRLTYKEWLKGTKLWLTGRKKKP